MYERLDLTLFILSCKYSYMLQNIYSTLEEAVQVGVDIMQHILTMTFVTCNQIQVYDTQSALFVTFIRGLRIFPAWLLIFRNVMQMFASCSTLVSHLILLCYIIHHEQIYTTKVA